MRKELFSILLSIGGELRVTTPYHSFEHVRGNAVLFLQKKTKQRQQIYSTEPNTSQFILRTCSTEGTNVF